MALAGSPGRRALLAGVILVVALTATSAQALASKPFERGLMDPRFSSGDAATRALWLGRAQDAGAGTVRFLANWRGISSDTPPANPTSPADPSYDWDELDEVVRDASARGFKILLAINRAPDWAEGPNREAMWPAGTWKPDPAKLGQFATAVATRYSGSYVDSGAGGGALPRVRDWQVWAEPNLFIHLNPQWEGGHTFSPPHYRRMLNTAYASIKRVSGSNRVVAAATAPFGNEGKGVPRMPPLRFWRDLLCLKGKKLKRTKCPGGKARLDVAAHNPLSWAVGSGDSGPWTPARKIGGPDDLVVADMHKLVSLLRTARDRRTIKPRRRTPLWAPELLWETNPPSDPGLSEETQARYLADAFYLLWRQGVSSVTWARLIDTRAGGGAITEGAGLYYIDEAAKLSLNAYRFPFVPVRKKGSTLVWGIAPQAGKVEVQSLVGGEWTTVKRLRTRTSRVFTGKLKRGAGNRFRAVIGGETSLERQPQ